MRRLVNLLRATKISLLAFLQTNADMPFLTLILSLRRTARKARSSSLHGNLSFICRPASDLFYKLKLEFLLNFYRSPDTAKVRSKMLYASSKDRFKRELDGIQVELQATDPTEMGLDVIRGRAN